MINKGEIRDFKSTTVTADEGDCLLDTYKDDEGIHIINVDFELDIFYHWVLDQNGQVVNFFIGSPIAEVSN